jgi:hypothetical protein
MDTPTAMIACAVLEVDDSPLGGLYADRALCIDDSNRLWFYDGSKDTYEEAP